MTYEDVNQIIDNLADKLGTTASTLLPELVKYKTVSCIANLVITGIIFVICGLIITVSLKVFCAMDKIDRYDSFEMFMFPIGLCVGGLLISFICIMINLHELIVWTNAPTGAAVYYILTGIRH